MAIEQPWKALSLSSRYPLLWLKFHLDGKMISFELTDLNRIWGMHMSKAELVQSASDQGCSIDPSDDDGQYEQFLSKTKSALDGEKKTTFSLEPGFEQDWIRLSLSAPLPGSLPTFQWSIDLHPMNQPDSTAIESNLLSPLLLHTSHLRWQIQQLIDELNHKDRIISKITDKLETSGNDLKQVFPGVSNLKISRKSSQRSQLAGHIRGLADFDEALWRSQIENNIKDKDLPVSEIDKILADLPRPGFLNVHKDAVGVWYRNCGEATVNGCENTDVGTAAKGKAPVRPYSLRKEESIDDPEFQRQITPPARTVQHNDSTTRNDEIAPTNGEDMDDSTEDEGEDDLDAPSQKSSKTNTASQLALESSQTLSHRSQPEILKVKTPPRRKLGRLGGRNAKSPPPGIEAETDDDGDTKVDTPPRSASKLGTIGRESKAQSNSPTISIDRDDSQKLIQASLPKQKGKLGAFGRKRTSSPPANGATAQSNKAGSPAAKTRAKLGAFGGQHRRKASPTPENEAKDIAPVASPRKTKIGAFGDEKVERDGVTVARDSRSLERGKERIEQARETSEERANKKRDQLKAEIEEQAKAPVKKKRKF